MKPIRSAIHLFRWLRWHAKAIWWQQERQFEGLSAEHINHAKKVSCWAKVEFQQWRESL